MPADPNGAPATAGPRPPVSTSARPGRDGPRGPRAPGRPAPGPAWPPGVDRRGPGRERPQVLAGADRPDAGAAAAVRDAEGLVQVEVADVGAEPPRPGQPDHRVVAGGHDAEMTA